MTVDRQDAVLTDQVAAYGMRVLRDAVSGVAPETEAVAGRMIAQLMRWLRSEGVRRPIAYLLGPAPGSPATFEVRIDRLGQVERSAARRDLSLDEALSEVFAASGEDADLVEVNAVGPSGLRRQVFEVRRGEGGPRFVFPHADAYHGSVGEVAAALEQWTWVIGWAGDQPDRPELDPAPVVDAVRDALADVTVELDLAAVEEAVGGALRAALAETGDTHAVGDGVDAEAIAEALAARLGPVAKDAVAVGPALRPPSAVVAESSLVTAAEQLHLELEAFEEQVRAGSRSLALLADELSARERTAARYTDQLAKSMSNSVERLGRRVEEQVGTVVSEARRTHDQMERVLAHLMRADKGETNGATAGEVGRRTGPH